ncbi:hypothetical protein D1F64_13500 [Breoghania sp. L-A4]|nr:hypothetical protein D1F64_13500 [Breoghania sp. L-A4]
MCRELRDLANRSQFGFLAYLLDMSRLEAEAQLKDPKAASRKTRKGPGDPSQDDPPPDPPRRRRSFFRRGQP